MSSVCLSHSDRREHHLTPDSAVNRFIDNEAQVDKKDKEDKEEEEENGASTYLSPCDSMSLTGIPRLYRQRLDSQSLAISHSVAQLIDGEHQFFPGDYPLWCIQCWVGCSERLQGGCVLI